MASFSKLQVRDGRHVRLGERVDLEPASLQTEDGPWALGCLGGGCLIGHRLSFAKQFAFLHRSSMLLEIRWSMETLAAADGEPCSFLQETKVAMENAPATDDSSVKDGDSP